MAVDSFWKRWKRDVFPTLVPRRKWRIEQNVRIDDVVTVTDENAESYCSPVQEIQANQF